MKVLLINPNAKVYSGFKLGKRINNYPPLGLLYLASYIEKQGHEVNVLDADARNLDISTILQSVKEFAPDVVGAGATTPEINCTAKMFQEIKDQNSEIITVLGGPHASAIPEETLTDFPQVDFIIIREGELSFTSLLSALGSDNNFAEISGIAYKNNGKIITNPQRHFIEDINLLPVPARHLVNTDDYMLCLPGKGYTRASSIQTIRGCPFKCIFCYRSKETSKIRFRKPELVVDEIQECVEKYKTEALLICDDTFSVHKKHVFKICDELINRKIDISWYCSMRADDVSDELVSKMKKAGLVMVSLGVETGSSDQLEAIGKKTELQDYYRAYNILRSHDIETRASFVIGLPHDTRKTINETINFAKKLNVKEAFFNISTPYPGSVLYDMGMRGDGFKIVTRNWSEYRRFGNAVIELEGITRQELINLQKKAFFKFYLRIRIIFHHLKYYAKYGHFVLGYKPMPFVFLFNFIKHIFVRSKKN